MDSSFMRTVRSGTVEGFCILTQKQWENEMSLLIECDSHYDFAVEEDGAIRDMPNGELGFFFASRRTLSGRIVDFTNQNSAQF